MGRQVSWDDVPDIALLEDGVYVLRIEEVTETQTSTGKLMYSGELRVIEPAQFKDLPLYDNFVIGSDDNAEASLDETWARSFGARRLKQLSKASQVPLDQDMDNLVASLSQQQVVAQVQVQEDKDPESKYFGRKNNRVAAYYPLGAMAPKVAGGVVASTGAPKAAAPRAAAPRPATPATPPRAAAPVRAQPRPAAGAPRPAPRPATPRAAAGNGGLVAPAATPATTKPKIQFVHCQECEQDIPRAEFAAHVDAHGEG